MAVERVSVRLRSRVRTPALSASTVMLGAILALATATRLAGIGSRLNVDDAYSWYVSVAPSAHDFLHRLAANENTPPLFYLILMLVPGVGPAWLRIPAALPGILMAAVVFIAMRDRLGRRVAFLAGLAIAVAPYLITYSDLARGFMLADLALLICVWALISLADDETPLKWAVFAGAGIVSVYTEYDSAIVLIALVVTALWIGTPRRWPTVVAGAVTLLSLAPWVPQIVSAENQVGVTKYNPMFATPSLGRLRDAAVSLAFGENGGTSSSIGRWLLFAVMLGIVAGAAIMLRRKWASRAIRERRTILLIAGTSVLTLIGYALAAPFGVDVFTQRYLTILVPLVAILAAVALVSLNRRWLVIAASVVLSGLGLAEVGRRFQGEWQPDLSPVRAAAASLHPRTVLTNTPVVLYYLPSFKPVFDRPYNLGPGLGRTCARPCLIIDDVRVHGGPARSGAGTQVIGPFLLTLER